MQYSRIPFTVLISCCSVVIVITVPFPLGSIFHRCIPNFMIQVI